MDMISSPTLGSVQCLIGLLQNAKNAVDQARALWQGKAYNTQAEAMLTVQSEMLRAQAAQQAQEIARLRQRIEAQAGGGDEAAVSFSVPAAPAETAEGMGATEVEFAPQMQTQALADSRKFQRRVKGMLR